MRRRTEITGGNPETELLGYYLIRDPKLSEAMCESGSFYFLQLVGITEDKLLQCESGETYVREKYLNVRQYSISGPIAPCRQTAIRSESSALPAGPWTASTKEKLGNAG